MTTFATYCDVQDFIGNWPTNIETPSLVGINSILTGGPYAIGVTSITVNSATGVNGTPSTSNPMQCWILDGLNSEIVQITAISSNTLTLASPGLVAAHSAGASVSTAGTAGCLARVIASASRSMDTFCRQGPAGTLDRTLYAVSRTETYRSPSMRCHTTVDATFVLMPYHFPVQSVTSISMQMGTTSGNTMNLAALVLPQGARTIEVPVVSFVGGIIGQLPANTVALRNTEMWATLVYSGGPINGTSLTAVPDDIRQACYLYTQHWLSYRQNPIGAAEYGLGDFHFSARLRGDKGNKSLLAQDADELLRPYAAARS